MREGLVGTRQWLSSEGGGRGRRMNRHVCVCVVRDTLVCLAHQPEMYNGSNCLCYMLSALEDNFSV